MKKRLADIQKRQEIHEQSGMLGSMGRVRSLAAEVPWLLVSIAKVQTEIEEMKVKYEGR